MLDTNICIYLIKKKPAGVLKQFQRTDPSQVAISSIALSELLYGVSKSARPEQNHIALAHFIAPLEVLPYENDAATHYGMVRTQLERQGTPIGALDMLIAAHALATDSTLVTNNEKEFARMPGLRVENWVTMYIDD